MMEYTMRSPRWEGDIRLKFHDNGFLAEATMPEPKSMVWSIAYIW